MRRQQSAYDVLGLPYDAPASQVRSRYRQLARRHQPDLEPQDLVADETFRRILLAYLVLDSPRRTENTRLVRASRDRPVETPDLYSRLPLDEQLLLAADAGSRDDSTSRRRSSPSRPSSIIRAARAPMPCSATCCSSRRSTPKPFQCTTTPSSSSPTTAATGNCWRTRRRCARGAGLLDEQTRSPGSGTCRCRTLFCWRNRGHHRAVDPGSALRPRPSLFFGLPGEMLVIAALDGMLAGLILARTICWPPTTTR